MADDNKPTVEPAVEPTADGSTELCHKLGLSAEELDRYEELWSQADTDGTYLSAGSAGKFLGTSGLPQGDLTSIWVLSDTTDPKGKLVKHEFFVACKLVAIRQRGGEIALGALAEPAPAPRLGANKEKRSHPEGAACFLCDERYDLKQRCPKVLPCLHVFCLDCLGKWSSAQPALKGGDAGGASAGVGGFTCPACIIPCPTPPDELINDVAALKVAEKASASDGTLTVVCAECEEDRASSFCVECDMYYCTDCLRCGPELGKGKRKRHCVQTVAEHLAQLSSAGASAVGPKCRVHGKELELFCETCDLAICVACSLQHKAPQCTVGLVEDLLDKHSRQLTGLIAGVEDELPGLETGVTRLEEVVAELESNQSSVLTGVQKLFESHRAVLQAREAEVIKQLAAEAERKRVPLLKQKGLLEATVAHIRSGVGFAQRTLAQGSAGEVLQAKRLTAEGLELLRRHGCTIKPQCSPRLTFVNTTPALESTVASYGSISGADTNPAACTADGEGLKFASVGQKATFTVQAYDWEGQTRSIGGDLVQVLLIPGHSTEVDENGVLNGLVDDLDDGSYKCTYTPVTTVGTWRLEVRVNGAQIVGSPFNPKIETAQTEKSGHGRVKKRHSSSAVAEVSSPSRLPEEPVVPAEFLSAFSGGNLHTTKPEPVTDVRNNASAEVAPEQPATPEPDNSAIEAETVVEYAEAEPEINVASVVVEADGADADVDGVESEPDDDETLATQWIVIYDYVAQDEDELSVGQGDILIDVADVSPGWVTGTIAQSSTSGMVPSNYIEPL